jgi:hypothetical protein
MQEKILIFFLFGYHESIPLNKSESQGEFHA